MFSPTSRTSKFQIDFIRARQFSGSLGVLFPVDLSKSHPISQALGFRLRPFLYYPSVLLDISRRLSTVLYVLRSLDCIATLLLLVHCIYLIYMASVGIVHGQYQTLDVVDAPLSGGALIGGIGSQEKGACAVGFDLIFR